MARPLIQILGPGLLFAATAVGVSHLVQSTRAGADYGLALWAVIVLACAFKYPAFLFGNIYAASTGDSLIDNYRRQGLWVVLLAMVAVIGSAFIGIAALSLVAAGVVKTVFSLPLDARLVAYSLLVLIGIILIAGSYRWFETLIKMLVATFAISTVIATVLVLPSMQWEMTPVWPETVDLRMVLFIVALAGWMPAPLEGSVMQSLWTCAKANSDGRAPTLPESRLDYNIGFTCTLVLALCFMLLGSSIMHSSGIKFEASPAGFAAQIIGLFTTTIGSWSRPIIGAAALAVILSTLVTVVDGYPRAFAATIEVLRGGRAAEVQTSRNTYIFAIITLCAGATLILAFLMTSFKAFIDVSTSVSFCVAPLLAYFNHRAITSKEVPAAARPTGWLYWLSITGITAMGSFALFYLYLLVVVL